MKSKTNKKFRVEISVLFGYWRRYSVVTPPNCAAYNSTVEHW